MSHMHQHLLINVKLISVEEAYYQRKWLMPHIPTVTRQCFDFRAERNFDFQHCRGSVHIPMLLHLVRKSGSLLLVVQDKMTTEIFSSQVESKPDIILVDPSFHKVLTVRALLERLANPLSLASYIYGSESTTFRRFPTKFSPNSVIPSLTYRVAIE